MAETLETILAILGLTVAIGTILRRPLELVSDKLSEYAATTPSTTDDTVAGHFATAVGYFGWGLDLLARMLPVITTGKQARK